MNALEHFLCSTSVWRHLVHRQLLPWMLENRSLGDHLLEIGAGYGAATGYLRERVPRVTSLEYDYRMTRKLRSQTDELVVCGDAARLPFAERTFSSAIAILTLHHLRSRELQDSAFAEIFRVLRPGGLFLAFEIEDGWIHRVGHFRSTFLPVAPGSLPARLAAAGFSEVAVDRRRGGFRMRAHRP